MTAYDDPWAYCARLFFKRLAMFLALCVLLWLTIWAALLHWVFGADGMAILQGTWTVIQGAQLHWRVIFWLSAVQAVLVSTIVFLLLMMRSRASRDVQTRRARLSPVATG